MWAQISTERSDKSRWCRNNRVFEGIVTYPVLRKQDAIGALRSSHLQSDGLHPAWSLKFGYRNACEAVEAAILDLTSGLFLHKVDALEARFVISPQLSLSEVSSVYPLPEQLCVFPSHKDIHVERKRAGLQDWEPGWRRKLGRKRRKNGGLANAAKVE